LNYPKKSLTGTVPVRLDLLQEASFVISCASLCELPVVTEAKVREVELRR